MVGFFVLVLRCLASLDADAALDDAVLLVELAFVAEVDVGVLLPLPVLPAAADLGVVLVGATTPLGNSFPRLPPAPAPAPALILTDSLVSFFFSFSFAFSFFVTFFFLSSVGVAAG